MTTEDPAAADAQIELALFDDALDEAASVEDTWTPAEVLAEARDAIRDRFASEIWVAGEIDNLNRSAKGHVYFSLVDHDEDGSRTVALRVTLWNWDRRKVNQRIKDAHGQIRMDNGVRVRIRGKVDLYDARGEINLRMTSIDPEFTLGHLAAARAALVAELHAAGLLEANGRLPLPTPLLRVGVITSRGSAAEADFLSELESAAFAFHVELMHSTVQGPDAPTEVAAALDAMDLRDVDAIALIRGGGARTELAAFDSREVAEAIARCRRPVITGIGHEIDTSLADVMAHTAMKTPTATAAFIVDTNLGYEMLMERAFHAVSNAARRDITEEFSALHHQAGRLQLAVGHQTRQHHQRVHGWAQRLRASATAALRVQRVDQPALAIRSAAERLRRRESELDATAATVALYDPSRLATRGFALIRAADGGVITSAHSLQPGDPITLTFADGAVPATVDEAQRGATPHG